MEIDREIREMCNKYKLQSFKPHKLVAILATIKIIQAGKCKDGKIYFDGDFKRIFTELFTKYASGRDRDRPHTPFFHLRSSSFWELIPKPGKEQILKNTTTIGGPQALIDIVECAQLSDEFVSFVHSEETSNLLESILHDTLFKNKHEAKATTTDGTVQISEPRLVEYTNEFVDYLNSLQRTSAKNENSLAESQACNPLFAQIHVPHPIATKIVSDLIDQNGRHVILTGHAGDGKSTVALETFKLLNGIPTEDALSSHLTEREDIPNQKITIIKDLSERHREKDNSLIQELLLNKRRFLLVTNTGTLLDFFAKQISVLEIDKLELESQVLTAISQPSGESDLILGGIQFHVLNMALMDNLQIARHIFEKIITSSLWDECTQKSCRSQCPICMNIDLIKHNKDRVLDRVFLAYRRMYEYGVRLTIRQLTEHIAYMVTSGLEEAEIKAMHKRRVPIGPDFMFFNRFFGDNGRVQDASAQQMQAVQEIRRQEFGGRLFPAWERKLWLRTHGERVPINVAGYSQQFDTLRDLGGKAVAGATHVREQVRRILYFLYDFPEEDQSYLSNYLNSPAILQWFGWQNTNAKLKEAEKVKLRQQVFHVLQEHLTGVRLPEVSSHHRDDQRLYVTLSRRRNEVRQSAQVVLAYVDWSTATSLTLDVQPSVAGDLRTELVLKGHDRIEGVDLPLTLPFLDYVLMRHFGELGEVLQAAYIERLERYKAQIQEKASSLGESVMLVRLKTDHTFRRQHYSVHNEWLEVNDV